MGLACDTTGKGAFGERVQICSLRLPGLSNTHGLSLHHTHIVALARGEQMRIEFLKGSRVRDGHHEIAPRKAHTVFDSSFLVTLCRRAEVALKQEKAQVETEKQQARERTAGDQKELEQLQADRKRIGSQMSPKVMASYERVRKLRRGIAVAEAVDGRCSQCQMSLRLQFFQDLKRDEQVMYCESCSRILYYNPPASFEDVTGEAAPAARS